MLLTSSQTNSVPARVKLEAEEVGLRNYDFVDKEFLCFRKN